MLDRVKPKAGETFYDLGCATGLPLIAASLLYPDLRLCKGIELLNDLVKLGQQLNLRKDSHCRSKQMPSAQTVIMQGDILQEDWSDGDVIFASAVCYSVEVLEGIADRCRLLKKGTRLIVLNYLPDRPYIELQACCKVSYSWGLQQTNFYLIV